MARCDIFIRKSLDEEGWLFFFSLIFSFAEKKKQVLLQNKFLSLQKS